MSEGNAEKVRKVFEALSRGDLDAALAGATNDFEVDWTNSIGLLNGVYRGRDEVREVFEHYWVTPWDRIRFTVKEAIEVGDEAVVVVSTAHMRGRESGVEVEGTGASVWTLSDGRLAKVVLHQTKADAFEALA